MKLKTKQILLCLVLMSMIVLIAGCGQTGTPYQQNDKAGYTVSVRYDANGGFFTTNTQVITDSYNISALPEDGEGKVKLGLCAPEDPSREDRFDAEKAGYFLAGWYEQRTQIGEDANGEPIYSYAKKWDFDKDLWEVDLNGQYTASQPVLTLYAAWTPLFTVEIYDFATGELMEQTEFDPGEQTEFLLPVRDGETGGIDMKDFVEKPGYTYKAAYYDRQGTIPVETAALVHNGVVNSEDATAENSCLKVYVDWIEGEWFEIHTAQQFANSASATGNYIICEDLDFTEVDWPTTFMYGNFSGTIEGNGYAFRNIQLEQTNNSKVNAGLFGNLTADARLTDVHFDNVKFTVKNGSRVPGTCYGLLAGTVSAPEACAGITISNSMLLIDSGCFFGTDDYAIGLVCGKGAPEVDASGIACQATGEAPENIHITVADSVVTVEFAGQ